jgi:hypothetical protein
MIGNSPIDYHNAVVAAELAPEEADAAILESLGRMRAWDVPGTRHVGPRRAPSISASASPPTVSSTVETHGSGFGEGPVEAEWVGEMYRRIRLGDDVT